MALDDIAKGISTTKTMVSVVVYLFMAIIAFIMWYPVYKIIRSWTTNTSLSAIMYICFWLVAFIVVYYGVFWKMEGDDYSQIIRKG